jgi:quercetin dioxygenase-like cupin family protein
MAKSGQIIENRVTGERVKYLKTAQDTDGTQVVFEMWAPPNCFMPVRHIHLQQTEEIEVLSGVFKVECNGKVQHLQAGEKMLIPPKAPHQWWNESEDETVHTRFSLTPAYNFEVMQEQIFGIFNTKGKLSFLQIMVMAKEYDMIIAGPPIFLQKIMWFLLAPIGRLLGLKNYYPAFTKS